MCLRNKHRVNHFAEFQTDFDGESPGASQPRRSLAHPFGGAVV